MITPRTARGHLVVLAAGGTGGHVFPAEALAQELLAQGCRLALMTDKRGTAYGGTLGLLETHRVSAQGLAGQGPWGRVTGIVALSLGFFEALRILQEMRPAAVVGFGGYASAPTVAAAVRLGLRTVIHEQNAVLGRANRLLAARVDRVCTSFDLVRRPPKNAHLVQTGMPVRPAIAALRAAPYAAPTATGPFRILVLGGSQGARVFSDIIPGALLRLPENLRERLEIAQQCRPEDLDRTHAAYARVGVHVQLRHFFDNVPELLANTHLLIARSGASTVAEATVIGRPSLLVPYPFAADDHQTSNAQALAAHGGGWMLRQREFTEEVLAQRLLQFASAPYGLAGAAAAASSFAVPDAANRLAEAVIALIHGENGARTTARPVSTHPMNRGIV